MSDDEPPTDDDERLAAEEAAMREFLDEALRTARLSRNETDQKLGLPRGETGRILRGQRRLTYRHILMLAEAAGLPTEGVFLKHHRRRIERSRAMEQLRRYAAQPAPEMMPSTIAVDLERLQQLIATALEEALDRREDR